MAGVQHDKVGIFDVFGARIAFAFQNVSHALGIVDIHLAPVRFYENTFCRSYGHPSRQGSGVKKERIRPTH